jgi:hypothetical protein
MPLATARHIRWAVLAAVLGVVALASSAVTPPSAHAVTTWQVGDVFAAVSGPLGSYKVYDNAGNFKEQINQGVGGATTGCAFNNTLTHLYTTNFGTNTIFRFQDASPHPVDLSFPTPGPGGSGLDQSNESIVFMGDGNLLVGHADGADDVHKYDPNGVLLAEYAVASELRGSDWIDLAADQTTLFYTSEGKRVLRFDIGTNTQLADFATGLPGSNAYALRILPPGDGSGGVLVADTQSIVRLNGAGNVVQTYDVANENGWFSLNLDPNGTSFWAGNFPASNNFYRFNINTGAVEVGPINTGAGTALFGLCLKGEPTAAVPEADKEVEDIILDDGSGFDQEQQGPPLQQIGRDPDTRTTFYRLRVEVSTNPIISVVSLERNRGDETDSSITYLASIDDGHPAAAAHVAGAYIKDKGFPKGSAPDLLTCISDFNPDNPLEQNLRPCITEEKIPGDGNPTTAESDLHFQLVQEANSRLEILRFFKLHCLSVGEHSITFYNKAEPKEIEDPDLSNNWWRAILKLECVPGAPATLTLDPPTDINPVDTKHTVTATVRDAFGNPTPGITVRFSVTGSVSASGSCTTDANGQCSFTYTGPPLPGADVITAFADTNNDGDQDPGEPSGAATKTWVLPITTPGCVIKITNGGWIYAMNGDRSSFGGVAMADAEGNVKGEEEYQDQGPVDPFNLHGNVLVLVCGDDGKSGTIFGTATIDGMGSHIYRIDVVDNSEPGNKPTDTYHIRIDKPYDSGNQPLQGGNIQVKRTA